jgi:hypothetical protein
MGTVRYRGLSDDPGPGPEGDFVADSHQELPELVASI